MKCARANILVKKVVLLSLLLAPLQGFAREIQIPNESCYELYKTERNGLWVLAGASATTTGATFFMPLLIIADLFVIPAGVIAGISAFKMGNMVALIEQVYKGEGDLLDEFVEELQKVRPELTREEIRNRFIHADSKLMFCSPTKPGWITKGYLNFNESLEMLENNKILNEKLMGADSNQDGVIAQSDRSLADAKFIIADERIVQEQNLAVSASAE